MLVSLSVSLYLHSSCTCLVIDACWGGDCCCHCCCVTYSGWAPQCSFLSWLNFPPYPLLSHYSHSRLPVVPVHRIFQQLPSRSLCVVWWVHQHVSLPRPHERASRATPASACALSPSSWYTLSIACSLLTLIHMDYEVEGASFAGGLLMWRLPC